MDFSISEEQEMLQDTLRAFIAKDCDALRVHRVFNGPDGWDPELWKGLCGMGIPGLLVPEEYGGSGMELLDLALACEVLGEGAAPVPILGHSLAALALRESTNHELRDSWLPRLASGEAIATVAFGETQQAWQPDEWRCRHTEQSLHGEKLLVPHATAADIIIVGAEGGGLAVVERGANGATLEPFDGVDRTRPTASLRLDAAPCKPLDAPAGTADRVRDAALVLLAADAFGGAWHLLHETVEYLKTRKQFGTILTQFQGIKHQLANLVTELEPTRALYWYAAHAWDHLPDEAERSAAIAKAHLTDRAMDIARECVELHGGIGFTWECNVHIWYRRAMFNRTWLGDPSTHRERSARLADW